MSEHHKKQRDLSAPRWWFRGGLLLLAFAARAASLDAQGLWRDEVDQWRFALQPWPEMLRNFTRPGWNGPLYSPLLRIWIALTGESVYAMRYSSLVCGVLGVAVVYVLGRRLMKPVAAALSALLLALSPYMVWYAQEIKMYTWVPLLVLIALYALDRACRRPDGRLWLVVLLATSFAFYSHILAALLIPVEVMWFWLHPRRHPRAWRGALIVALLLTLPYLPLLHWQWPMLWEQRETGYPSHSLLEMTLVLFNGWSLGVYQGLMGETFPMLIGGVLWAGLVMLGVGELLLRGRERTLARLVGWMVVPLLIVWLVSLRNPMFTDRYLVWAAPAFYLLAGGGLAAVGAWRRWAVLPLLFLTLSLDGVALYAQARYPVKPQFPLATAYLTQRRDPDDLVLFQIPYNRYVMAYYADGPLEPWAEGPYTNWPRPGGPPGSYQVDADFVDAEMREIVAGFEDVWLIYSEAALWDARDLVRAWLEAHGQLMDQKSFAGVEIYHYRLRSSGLKNFPYGGQTCPVAKSLSFRESTVQCLHQATHNITLETACLIRA
jgi:hypothetical protein